MLTYYRWMDYPLGFLPRTFDRAWGFLALLSQLLHLPSIYLEGTWVGQVELSKGGSGGC